MNDALERALVDLERPKANSMELTGQTLPVRVYGTPALHRAVPTPVALRLAALRGWIEWRLVPRRRDEVRRLLRAVTGSAPSEELVRRGVVDDAIRAELYWRPWLARTMPVEGLEHLANARAHTPAGLLFVNLHLGPFMAMIHALAERGLKLYVPGELGSGARASGRGGRWALWQNRWVEEAGSRWVPRGGSFPLLRALLERGESVFLAADVAGETEVGIGGRHARVRTGIARLALETGSWLLPVICVRRGWKQVGIVGEPIDPSGFDEPVALTQRIFAGHEDTLRRYPEQAHTSAMTIWVD